MCSQQDKAFALMLHWVIVILLDIDQMANVTLEYRIYNWEVEQCLASGARHTHGSIGRNAIACKDCALRVCLDATDRILARDMQRKLECVWLMPRDICLMRPKPSAPWLAWLGAEKGG